MQHHVAAFILLLFLLLHVVYLVIVVAWHVVAMLLFLSLLLLFLLHCMLTDQSSSPQQTSKRRKRQSDDDEIMRNGFVTVCEARFVVSEVGGEVVLAWACPAGVSAPLEGDLDEVCRVLIRRGLVMSCSSPSGLTLEDNIQELPSTT